MSESDSTPVRRDGTTLVGKTSDGIHIVDAEVACVLSGRYGHNASPFLDLGRRLDGWGYLSVPYVKHLARMLDMLDVASAEGALREAQQAHDAETAELRAVRDGSAEVIAGLVADMDKAHADLDAAQARVGKLEREVEAGRATVVGLARVETENRQLREAIEVANQERDQVVAELAAAKAAARKATSRTTPSRKAA